MVMINKNGNTLYCKSCSVTQREFRKADIFLDRYFNKLNIEKKMELFNKMIKLDQRIVWRKILT